MPLVPSTFADYLNQNRAGLALSPKDIIAYSIRNGTYLLTGELLRGRGEDDLYQQSDVIEETVILKDDDRFGTYTPGEDRQLNVRNVTQKLQFKARCYENATYWTEFESKLNKIGGSAVKVKDYAKTLTVNQQITHLNGIETTAWAQASYTAMEQAAAGDKAGRVFSINTAITEDNGAFTRVPPGWGANPLFGVDTIANPEFDNKRAYYNHNNIDNFGAFDGLVAALDTIELAVGYNPPSQINTYDAVSSLGESGYFVTNRDGMQRLKMLRRNMNDLDAAPGGDLGVKLLSFNGSKFYYHAPLDTALINQTRATSTTSPGSYNNTPYPVGRPRFFYINKLAFKPVFIAGKMFSLTKVLEGGLQNPDAYGRFCQSWFNNICTNRAKLGVVAPLTVA